MTDESPAERSLRLMRERPEILNACAYELFKSETGEFGMFAAKEWDGLSEFDREYWRTKALAGQAEFAALPAAVRDARNRLEITATIRRNDAIHDDDDDGGGKVHA